MDNRQLSTADILMSGIINIPAPKTAIPRDRDELEAGGNFENDYSYIGNDAVIAAIEAGKVATASNYYGIPYAWKQGDGVYRGTLLQYRAVTEDEIFSSAEAAAEWFETMYHRTNG